MKLWLHELGYSFFGDNSLYDISMPEIGSLLDGRRTRQAIKETHQYMQENDISPGQASHFADWAEEQGLAEE